MRIDAGGKQCPIPVIMAKKQLEAGEQEEGAEAADGYDQSSQPDEISGE